MNAVRELERIASRLQTDREDPRHTLLDVAAQFLICCESLKSSDARIAMELQELRQEIEAILPVFPSQHRTSPLFDRAGLGRTGWERGRRLAARIIAVSEALICPDQQVG